MTPRILSDINVSQTLLADRQQTIRSFYATVPCSAVVDVDRDSRMFEVRMPIAFFFQLIFFDVSWLAPFQDIFEISFSSLCKDDNINLIQYNVIEPCSNECFD